MASHFVTKSQIDLDACVRLGDEIALESYPALRAFLENRVSPQAARLFAEPLISRGNREAPATVSWYCDFEGDAKPVAQLDDQARSDFDAKLGRLLGELRPLLTDPDGGQLVAAALHVPKLSDIWSLNGEPVILNWGMVGDASEIVRERAVQPISQDLGALSSTCSRPPADGYGTVGLRTIISATSRRRRDVTRARLYVL